MIEEFDFHLIHRAGTSHGNADSMSRITPCEEDGTTCRQCHRHENIRCCAVQTRAQKRKANKQFTQSDDTDEDEPQNVQMNRYETTGTIEPVQKIYRYRHHDDVTFENDRDDDDRYIPDDDDQYIPDRYIKYTGPADICIDTSEP